MSKRMNSDLGVTGPQRLVIRMVARKPAISAGELAELLTVHPSTLTGPLRRLEERGLIRREVDPDDARRALFWPTEAGNAVNKQKAGTVEAAVKRALAKVNIADIEAAERVLEVISAELEAED
jgi:DNA-binding MarR family transcriptional regulator